MFRLKSRVNHQRFAREFNLARKRKADLIKFCTELRDSVQNGELTFSDFNIRHLFEHLVKDGREFLELMDERNAVNPINLLDAIGDAAVDTAGFQFTTGQLVINTVMKEYQKPEFIGPNLVTVESTRLDGETEPTLTDIGDQVEEVGEGDEFPDVGLGEDYIEIDKSKKKGMKIMLTKEMLLFEKTGELERKCKKVGLYTGINHEKERIDFATGISGTYKRKGYSAVSPYGNDSGDHDWDNLVAGNTVTNWRSFETAELALLDITDPHDGEPVLIENWQVIAPHDVRRFIKGLLTSKMVQQVDNQTNADTIRTSMDNPFFQDEILIVLSNQYVKLRTGSASTWFFGDFKNAIVEKEVWPLQVDPMPTGTIIEWSRQVVAGWLASRRSVLAWRDPRRVTKNTT